MGKYCPKAKHFCFVGYYIIRKHKKTLIHMRSTIHTPDPEVLEYQTWDITPKMEQVFSNYYRNLKDHLKEYHEAKWYKTSRTKRLVPNSKLYYSYGKHLADYEEYILEIIPESIKRYASEGLKGQDIVVIWFSEYEFVPITFEEFNTIYDAEVDKILNDPRQLTTQIEAKVMDRLGEIVETCIECDGIHSEI